MVALKRMFENGCGRLRMRACCLQLVPPCRIGPFHMLLYLISRLGFRGQGLRTRTRIEDKDHPTGHSGMVVFHTTAHILHVSPQRHPCLGRSHVSDAQLLPAQPLPLALSPSL